MTSIRALRLAVVALACLAGLTAAAGIATCPASSTTVFPLGQPCAAYNTCLSTFCTCQGATGTNTTTGQCIFGTQTTCALADNCTTALIPCLTVAAATTACNVSSLSALRLQLASLAGGAFYNGSVAEAGCQSAACSLVNQSVAAANACNLTSIYSNACTAPYVYSGVMTLSGDWTAILANASATAIVKISLTRDMSGKLGIAITITSLKAGSLIVGFTAPVSGSNPGFASALAAAASSSSWLTSTQAAYTANGGTGSLTVSGITAATTAPPPSPTTLAPTTPTPGGSVVAQTTVLAALLAIATAILVVV